MSFLNPLLLFGVLGLSLPILAHLLNRYQVKQTDWAAMRFLNRSVRVRSRQLRLRDLLLLLLRCLAMLLIVLGVVRPATRNPDGLLGTIGEQRAGIVIALDASFSMRHGDGTQTRFDRAVEKLEAIRETIRPGDPVTLVLLGSKHRVVAHNVAYKPEAFDDLLADLEPTFEPLDLDSLPRILKGLVAGMRAPQKEVYIITDMQEKDWKAPSPWFLESMKKLAKEAAVFVVPVEGGAENLAITGLDLVSGVLRKGTSARYRATVRNCGTTVAEGVRVSGLINNISVDTKVIPSIAPGTSESVSLFLSFRDPGPLKIMAKLADDRLDVDNIRRAVAVIRDRVSVLCVDGAAGGAAGSGNLIAAALRARGAAGKGQDDLEVAQVSWVDLPRQDLASFDVVILADVPDITPAQAAALKDYVRAGNGLIWFGGDYVKAEVWNKRSGMDGAPLLPAVIEEAESTSDAMGVGRPIDPGMSDHPVVRPLLSLPEDLLSETRFHRILSVDPAVTGTKVLTLAGSDAPVLLEQSVGRGHVFMFTTSAGPEWNNMAVTPVFPMLLQQMVTYLTAREFETPRLVGDTLSLSYKDEPDAAEAVFDSPSGDTVTVPVEAYRGRYVATLRDAKEAGFYMARVSLQAAGMPVAVNVDTRESTVKGMAPEEARQSLQGSGIRILGSRDELASAAGDVRAARSLWRVLVAAGLLLLVMEALLAEAMRRRQAGRDAPDRL